MSLTEKTIGISTKVGGMTVTGATLGLLYWCLFTTTWWPTIDPAPPAEIWMQFSVLASAVAGYYFPELAGHQEVESPE